MTREITEGSYLTSEEVLKLEVWSSAIFFKQLTLSTLLHLALKILMMLVLFQCQLDCEVRNIPSAIKLLDNVTVHLLLCS